MKWNFKASVGWYKQWWPESSLRTLIFVIWVSHRLMRIALVRNKRRRRCHAFWIAMQCNYYLGIEWFEGPPEVSHCQYRTNLINECHTFLGVWQSLLLKPYMAVVLDVSVYLVLIKASYQVNKKCISLFINNVIRGHNILLTYTGKIQKQKHFYFWYPNILLTFGLKCYKILTIYARWCVDM